MSAATLEDAVRQAIEGGCSIVQLREKECTSREFYEQAVRLKAVTDAHQVPLIINDRLDIAQATGAAGVHIGQEDMPAAVARRVLGEDAIIGVSAGSLSEAVQAEKDGADYLGIGAMYPTPTKRDADLVDKETLRAIRKAVRIPIVIIGGINQATAPNFKQMGIDGIAVVSAVIAAPDIARAARKLRAVWRG